MALPSCSSSFGYDVFLSFRGSDTRHGFTGHLYKALCDKGIRTFFDDEELRSGEEITPALIKAIQESRIAITVLSINYASSSFCLDELATIIDRKSKGMLVIPVFYKVDPSDVRHHKGSYGEALAKHERRFQHDIDKLVKWKMALSHVADFSGYHLENGDYEYKFIDRIIASVSEKINHPARLHVGDYLVGLESKVEDIMKLLNVGSDDGVRIIGIYGMGGVGKSTLAQVVYNNLIAQNNFDGLCFLENVKEKSNKHGLEHLQKILLQEILKEKEINVASVKQGALMIQHRLQRKKVLLVLDDVDNRKQIEAIVERPDWFGPNSIVIITTRDKQLLTSHEIKRTYEVEELNENDAFRLLAWKAFRKENVDPTYVKVLHSVLTCASGLPLALEVIGSDLFGKSVEEWESAIKQYKRCPEKEILEILKVSFDALEEEEKSVFLDIACCFKGYQLKEVEVILNAGYGDCMKHHIGVLVEKSLMKVSRYGDVKLHDLIQDMGRQIDQKESHEDPGKRRRLWLPKDIIEVLQDNTVVKVSCMGTSKIEIIYLDVPISDKEETIEWDGDGFKKMKNLKILIIKNSTFSEVPKCLPNSLRVLEWWRYPSHCLPSDFQPQNLVICKLPHTGFTSLELKKFVNLRVLNLYECESLTQIPDVSDLQNLKELSFKFCSNLITVHNSVGFLDKLEILDAYSCAKLRSFPPIKLTSLEILNFSFCSSLLSFPEILGKMENLRNVHLDHSAIEEIPFSFKYLVRLQSLHLEMCGIVQLPSSILVMPELTYIDAFLCKGLKWVKQEKDEENVDSIVSSKETHFDFSWCKLDDDFISIGFTRFAHVSHLYLAGNNFTFLPECIKDFQSLIHIDVNCCKHLQDIRGVPPNLQTFEARNCRSLTSSSSTSSMLINQARLKSLCLPGTCIPEWLDHKSRGPKTSFWFRNKFPDKVLCLLIAPADAYIPDHLAPIMLINGKVYKPRYLRKNHGASRIEMDHTYVFDLDWTLDQYDQFEEPLENEWNHVELTYEFKYEGVIDIDDSCIKATGIHLFTKESNNEDIQFTDPHSKRKLDCDLNSLESHNQRLVKKRCGTPAMQSWDNNMN